MAGGTRNITVSKQYKDGRAYFEAYVDSLKAAIENVSATVNLNLNQLAKDIAPSTYRFTNDGVAQFAKNLQQQIDEIQAGGLPITGTTSNDFKIRSSSNYMKLDASTLTTPVNITAPNESGEMVLKAATQTLSNKTFTLPQINDTSSDHQYIFAVSELAADRTVTLPLLTANDTFVFAAFTQTLTNKTLTSPVLTTPQINDTSSDHQYIFAVSELAADRTVTLPLLTANDTFVFAAFTQTLTNKTISGGTLSGTFLGSPTFNGIITIETQLNIGDGTSGTYIFLDRGASSTYQAQLRWSTSGNSQWSLGLDNNSTDNLYLKNGSGTSVWTIRDSDGQLLLPDVDPPTANYANRNSFAKGWVKLSLDGSGVIIVPTIIDSYNVSGLLMTGSTILQVNIDTNMQDADYVVSITTGNFSGFVPAMDWYVSSQAAGSFTIESASGSGIGSIGAGDSIIYHIVFFGDQ